MDRLESAYFDIPRITRTWATIILIVSLLCHFNLISPFHLVFGTHFILKRKEYWRLFSSFFYFGNFGIDFLFHVFFLTRYSRLLEQGSFRNRPADFLWMLLYSAASILVLAWVLLPNRLELLSSPMTFVIVYIWSRRNPFIHMNFLGVLNFQAPYLPWVLLGFGTLLHGLPWNDLIGAVVGHVYWYFEDIYPRLHTPPPLQQGQLPTGSRQTPRRIFQAPFFLMDILGQPRPSSSELDVLPADAEVPENQQPAAVPSETASPTTAHTQHEPPVPTDMDQASGSTSLSHGATAESTMQRSAPASSSIS